MKITIVGLGLIGGSLARHIKKHTDYLINAIDTNPETTGMALSQGVIDSVGMPPSYGDITFVCLYPQGTADYIEKHAHEFKQGSIVADVCGVKRYITERVDKLCYDAGVHFVGTHPMAGREFSGFEYSTDTLFDTASMIITPTELSAEKSVNFIEDFAYTIHFANVVRSSPAEHDTIIAYTSQLAHIVSSAYIKSPSHLKQSGFSAGSYQDLTRVAKLNEDMWTPLFLANRGALTFEIDEIIKNLTDYKNAIETGDNTALHKLLRQGRILKEQQIHTKGEVKG